MKKRQKKILNVIIPAIFAAIIIILISLFAYFTFFRSSRLLRDESDDYLLEIDNKETSEGLEDDEVSLLLEEQDTGEEESLDSSIEVIEEESDKDSYTDVKVLENIKEAKEVSPEEEKILDKNIEATEVIVKVYFPDVNIQFLVPEERTVSTANAPKSAIEEILKGPKSADLFRVIPKNVQLLNLEIIDGIAKVSFNKAFVEGRQASSVEDIFVIYSIVNTLTEFSNISAVEFYIDGEKINIYGGLDISTPVYRRSDLIKE